jgi:hypothetical protein
MRLACYDEKLNFSEQTNTGRLPKKLPNGAPFRQLSGYRDAVFQPLASDEGALKWSTWSTDGDLGVQTVRRN